MPQTVVLVNLQLHLFIYWRFLQKLIEIYRKKVKEEEESQKIEERDKGTEWRYEGNNLYLIMEIQLAEHKNKERIKEEKEHKYN